MSSSALYRIFVEAVDSIDALQTFLSEQKVYEATVYHAKGLWDGSRESTFVIEIVLQAHMQPFIEDLAVKLRDEYNQQAVGIQILPVEWILV